MRGIDRYQCSWLRALRWLMGCIGLGSIAFVHAQTSTSLALTSSINPVGVGSAVQFTAIVTPAAAINIDFPFGVGSSAGGTLYVRYDLVGATFANSVPNSSFSNSTNPASIASAVVAVGGLPGDAYVVIQYIASGTAVNAVDTARFNPPSLSYATSSATVKLSVHGTLSSAAGAQPSNSALIVTQDPKTITSFVPAALTVGTVDIYRDGVLIGGCGAMSLSSGSVSCPVVFASIGSYTITAVYSGTLAYLTSSASVTQSVGIALSPSSLPLATVGVPYGISLNANSGAAPYTFGLTGGALPSGITFSSAGVFSGAPQVAGTFPLSIQVTDGNQASTTYSLPLTVQKGAQTISFSLAVSGRVGTSINLAATANSGLPISYAASPSNVCSVTGTSLQLLAVGACTVTASQIGNQDYLAAAPINRTINVAEVGAGTLRLRSATGASLIGTLEGSQMVFSQASDPDAGFVVLAATDLDGNGARDLVYRNVTSGDVTEVRFWRDANSNLDTSLRSVRTLWRLDAFGDLDGDGKGDLVWRFTGQTANADDTGVSYVWFTDGNGVTQVRKRGGAPLNWTLAGAVDINRDRAADMIYVAPDNSIRVLMATANRTCANFQAGSLLSGYTVMKVGDFTGNRFGELFVRDLSTGQNRIIVLDGTGISLPQAGGDPDNPNASCTSGGQFVPTAVRGFFSADVTFQFFASVDLNGDGILDVIWMKPNRTLQIWLMARDGGIPQVLDNVGPVPVGFSAVAQ